MNIALIHRYYKLKGAVTPIINASIKEYLRQNIHFVLFHENFKKEENTRPFLGSLKFYWQVFKKIKNQNFDLIVTHSYPVCFLKPFIRTPVVLFVHNTGKEEFAVEKNTFFHKIQSKISVFFRSKSFKLADKLIAVSNMVKNILIEKYNITPNKIAVIYNGIDTNQFKPIHVKRTDKKFIILQRGTDSRKGFDLLVRWAPEIISAIPSVKFLILGKEINLPKKINPYFEFKDWVDFEKMPKIYSSVDLVVCPSRYDTFLNVAIEAMSCQKPVVVSDKSGVKELIQESKNGFISYLEHFNKKIIEVARRKDLKKISRNARKTVLKNLQWKNIVHQQIEVFNSLIKRK